MINITIDLPTLSRLYGDTRYPNILFDCISIPQGLSREDFTNELYRKSCGLEVMFSDGKLMYDLLRSYSHRRYKSWERMLNALESEYNPIENYDRYEDTENTANHNGKTVTEGNTNSSGKVLQVDTTKNKIDGNDTTSNSRIAYDSASLVKTDETKNNIADRTTAYTGQNDNTNKTASKDDTTIENKTDSNTKSHIHGNIGVTTAQQMITEEMRLRTLDIIEIICNEIVDNFCIKVW